MSVYNEEWGIELTNGDVVPAMNEQDAYDNATFPARVVVRYVSDWEYP